MKCPAGFKKMLRRMVLEGDEFIEDARLQMEEAEETFRSARGYYRRLSRDVDSMKQILEMDGED